MDGCRCVSLCSFKELSSGSQEAGEERGGHRAQEGLGNLERWGWRRGKRNVLSVFYPDS